jgi:hypothetical protein
MPHAVIGPGQSVVGIGRERLVVPIFGVVIAAKLAACLAGANLRCCHKADITIALNRCPLLGVKRISSNTPGRDQHAGSTRLTHLRLLDFCNSYYTGRRLFDHLNSDGLDCRSDRAGGFFHRRAFGLSLGDRSLCRLPSRSL